MQPITVRHLLTHTAGLVRESPPLRSRRRAQSDAEIVASLYQVPLRFTPGSKWEYSNAGYYVLAEIVTRLSGQPWTQFLRDRVLHPAGMTLTVPTNAAPLPARLAVGYGGKDNAEVAEHWIALRPRGAFFSTVEDLAKWDQSLYTDTILSGASRRQMWTPVRLADGTTYPYGFGWHTETRKDGRRVAWHGGGLPGFAAYFGRFDERLTIVLLTNGNDVDMPAVGNGLADLYLAGERRQGHAPRAGFLLSP